MTFDYTAQLRLEYEELRKKVRSGMLPLVARVPAIEKAVKTYVEALDGEFERKRAKAIAEGRSVNTVPIPYRDERLLQQLADLVIHEELTWSHPDKMSIVEYPVMSERQEERFERRNLLKDELQYGDIRYLGRRRVTSSMLSDDGEEDEGSAPVSRYVRILEHREDEFDDLFERIELKDAIKSAKLTDRQKQSLGLVYVEDMTQEQAAKLLNVKKHTINEHLTIALRKLRERAELLTF